MKILKDVILLLVGILFVLLVQEYQLFSALSLFVKQNISIIAVIASPLIALWVSEEMRKRTDKHRDEMEILKNLFSYRHKMDSMEFLSALNRINLIFDKNKKIKQQVKELWRSYTNNENPLITDQKVIDLIYIICKYKGYNVSESEINNLFKPR